MPQKPIATLALCLLTITLALLPDSTAQTLYFDINALESGQWAGLLTGHWMHVGAEHLLWNVSALAILGTLVEQHSRRLLLTGLLFGMASVDLLLLSPLSEISRYCGLSGILNTLLGLVLFIAWQRTRSGIVLGVGALSLAKIFLEIALAESLFTSTTWPPYALAHLAGLAAAPLALSILTAYRSRASDSITDSFMVQSILKLRTATVRRQRNDPTIKSTYR